MSADVLEAFEILLEAMSDEKVQLAEAVKEATLSGNFVKAQELLAKVERVERLMKQVRQLQDAWKQLDRVMDSSVTGVELHVTSHEEKIDDSPELELTERLFDKYSGARRVMKKRVHKTPNREYRIPILEALEELGGRGSANEVLNLVYEKMKDRLTEDDLQPLVSGDIRWAKTAHWERYFMVREGLLKSDSPRGIWEITEAGRAYLKQARRSSGERR